MLDKDVAVLYETAIWDLNLTVKRNSRRFPEGFMFRLTREEFEELKFQIGNSDPYHKDLPYAFTEQGIAMLSGVLDSEKAVTMNIAVMKAYVEIGRTLFR